MIQPAQMFGRRGLTRKLVSQVVGDARKSSPPDFPQNRVLARKITEGSRLADFKRLHHIVNTRLLIPPLADQSNRSIDDLLTQTCLFAVPAAERDSTGLRIAP